MKVVNNYFVKLLKDYIWLYSVYLLFLNSVVIFIYIKFWSFVNVIDIYRNRVFVLEMNDGYNIY